MSRYIYGTPMNAILYKNLIFSLLKYGFFLLLNIYFIYIDYKKDACHTKLHAFKSFIKRRLFYSFLRYGTVN